MKKTSKKDAKCKLTSAEKKFLSDMDDLSVAAFAILNENAEKVGLAIDAIALDVAFSTKACGGCTKSVPTSDNIKIPKSVVDQCKEPAKSALSFDEKKKVVRMRKAGMSIKAIAKAIHKRDRAVSAFLNGR